MTEFSLVSNKRINNKIHPSISSSLNTFFQNIVESEFLGNSQAFLGKIWDFVLGEYEGCLNTITNFNIDASSNKYG